MRDPSSPLNAVSIRFEGEAYYGSAWDQLLRDLGFRLSGGVHEKAIYVSGGNHLVANSQGFVRREGQQGYEWQLILKQSRRWEGVVKFHAVLLAAFVVPQGVTVTFEDVVFSDAGALKEHAEAAILGDFEVEELMEAGVYRIGDGVQFA